MSCGTINISSVQKVTSSISSAWQRFLGVVRANYHSKPSISVFKPHKGFISKRAGDFTRVGMCICVCIICKHANQTKDIQMC